MGMVMKIVSVDPEAFDPTAPLEEMFDGEAWEADKMWWAALDLVLGPGGSAGLGGVPLDNDEGYTPAFHITNESVREIADQITSVTPAVLTERFDHGAFGEPLGPSVSLADRDWLPGASADLVTLIRTAAATGNDLIWIIA